MAHLSLHRSRLSQWVSRDKEMRELSCMRIISKVATLAAIAYKTSIGKPSPTQQSHPSQCVHVATSDRVLSTGPLY